MSGMSFEPRGFLQFDLASGRLQTRDRHRHFVVPEQLIAAAGDGASLSRAARKWGAEQGRLLAGPSKSSALEGSPEVFLSSLGNLLASLGWGRPELESWGGVLFVVVSEPPTGTGAEILAAFLSGAFEALAEERFDCVPMADGRFLLVGATGAAAVRNWVGQGAGAAEVVTRMLAGEHLAGAAGGR